MSAAPALRLVPTSEQSVADQIADVLVSGLTGTALMAALNRSFATASRADVFTAVAMAISLHEADRIGLLHDLAVAQVRAGSVT
jgi:hypothetical protein